VTTGERPAIVNKKFGQPGMGAENHHIRRAREEEPVLFLCEIFDQKGGWRLARALTASWHSAAGDFDHAPKILARMLLWRSMLYDSFSKPERT